MSNEDNTRDLDDEMTVVITGGSDTVHSAPVQCPWKDRTINISLFQSHEAMPASKLAIIKEAITILDVM
jgi:hypothetical protein